MDSAVRIVSCDLVGPIETATISVTTPFSLRRTASSTAISSKGFIDILTLASSTPEPSDLDPDLDIVVDHALDGDEDFHCLKAPECSNTCAYQGRGRARRPSKRATWCGAILRLSLRQFAAGLRQRWRFAIANGNVGPRQLGVNWATQTLWTKLGNIGANGTSQVARFRLVSRVEQRQRPGGAGTGPEGACHHAADMRPPRHLVRRWE